MIGLVACCKTKLDRAAPASELYTSPLFKLSLAHALSHCEAVYVASAQHDLVELDRVLAPYNRTMTSLAPMQRKLFGAAVARGLVDRHGARFELLVLAGAAYVDPIRVALARMGAQVELREPLARMQIGERLSFLSRSGRDPTGCGHRTGGFNSPAVHEFNANPADLPVSPNPELARREPDLMTGGGS